MIQILDFVKYVSNTALEDARCVIDATIGNGQDTLWLATVAQNAQIYGFDIQKDALLNTKKRFAEASVSMHHVHLMHDSHANMKEYVQGDVDFIIFNFGYLPGGDKTITTKKETTLKAIKEGLELLKQGGVMVLVMYPGHPEGAVEQTAVKQMIEQFSWTHFRVYCYKIMNNTKKPPVAYIIQKMMNE